MHALGTKKTFPLPNWTRSCSQQAAWIFNIGSSISPDTQISSTNKKVSPFRFSTNRDGHGHGQGYWYSNRAIYTEGSSADKSWCMIVFLNQLWWIDGFWLFRICCVHLLSARMNKLRRINRENSVDLDGQTSAYSLLFFRFSVSFCLLKIKPFLK